MVNEIANAVFEDTKNFAVLAILIFMWTFKGDLLNVFLDANDTVAGGGATLDQMIRQVHVDVYLQLSAVAVLIGAIVLAWRWLFSRASASDILGKVGAMVLVAGFALFYGGAPGGGGPHAAGLLKTANDWTNEITAVVLSAFAGNDCETPSLRQGNGDDYGESTGARTARRDLALDCAAEALYEVTIYTPWAVGELGKYEREPRGPDGRRATKSETEVLSERILKQQAYSFADLEHDGADAAHYRDGRRDRDAMDQDICTGGGPDAKDPATFTGKLCDRSKMRQDAFGADDDQFKEAKWSWSRVVPGKQPMYWENWSGGHANDRFGIALLSLIGSSSIALIIIIVSLAYLMLEIATVMFALMAPVAFLVGLIPGFGTRVLLRWLELLLGTFIKRIVLGLFVGLLMALYSVVLTTQMQWLMKLLLVCMIAAIGLMYRKRFTEAFSFNFSGNTAFHEDGEAAGKVKDTAASAAGGALGAKAAGGSALAGARAGAVRGMAPQRATEA